MALAKQCVEYRQTGKLRSVTSCPDSHPKMPLWCITGPWMSIWLCFGICCQLRKRNWHPCKATPRWSACLDCSNLRWKVKPVNSLSFFPIFRSWWPPLRWLLRPLWDAITTLSQSLRFDLLQSPTGAAGGQLYRLWKFSVVFCLHPYPLVGGTKLCADFSVGKAYFICHLFAPNYKRLQLRFE